MKKFLILTSVLILAIFSFLIQSCNDKNNQKKVFQPAVKITPVEYNDSIIGFQEKVIKKVLDFSQNFQMLDTVQRVARLNDVITEIDNALTNLKSISPFYGNLKLRDAAITWMNFYRTAFDKDYREVINIAKKPENEITENDIIRMNDISKSVAEKEQTIHKEFESVQQEFYQQFDIKGQENEINKKIDNSDSKKQK